MPSFVLTFAFAIAASATTQKASKLAFRDFPLVNPMWRNVEDTRETWEDRGGWC